MSSISSDTNELNSILGTYRGWGNFQVEHLILMISVLTGLLFFYSIALTRRLNFTQTLLNSMPRLTNPFNNIEFSEDLKILLSKEKIRQSNIRSKIQPDDAGMGDDGWGYRTKDSNEKIQITSEIVKSFLVIDKMVNKRRPALKHQKFRSVRDYMLYLLKEFPTLSSELIYNYISFYERARFGPEKFKNHEWPEVRDKIISIQEAIEMS